MRGVSAPSQVLERLYSEHDRLFADKVMTEKDWQQLRKATHRHRVQPLVLARVVLGYWPLLCCVALLSLAVGVYDITLVKWYRWPMLSVTSVQTFFGAITFALTLLLVFKTNSSYARWWEARKDVGQLVSLVHNIMRQAVGYFPPHQAHLTHALGRWIAAVMWTVKALVRPGAPLRDELQGVLTPEELTWLLAQPHKQLALGQALTSILAAAEIDPMAKSRLDSMLTLFTFEFGACGRIYNTAIPSAYTRHTSRFLITYILIGLPLLLWPLAKWSSPFLAVLISFLLLGVENIGSAIEEPFHVIAFDAFCAAIQRDVGNILAMHDNSQCLSCASQATAARGGNVPIVRDLSYFPPESGAHSNLSCRDSVERLSTPQQQQQQQHAGVGSAAAAAAVRSHANQQQQQQKRRLSGGSFGSRADAATAAHSNSRSSLHIDVAAGSTAAAAGAPAAAGVPQQPQGAAAGVLLTASDSRTCLLSAAHTHRE